MHICFLSQEFPRPGIVYGGIGTFLLTFSNQLILQGHQVTVVGISGEKFQKETLNGVTLVTIPRSKSRFLGWWRNFKEISGFLESLHKEHPIDIIEGSELNFAFLPKMKNIPFVIRLHGGHHFFAQGEQRKVERWKGFQERVSFTKADAFVAVSEYVKVHTGRFLSFQNKPVEVINYPVSFEKFYPSDSTKMISGRLVFAGTVCEKKGVRQLIQSLPSIQKVFPNVHLQIYGRDWNFPDGRSYIQYLKTEFSEKALSAVTFHGAVSHEDLPEIYEQAQVCIFPSHIETQGLVAPEAMAMEKPVIFSKSGPGPETIDHGINGWLCDPHDPKDIAKSVITAFQAKDSYPEIGKEARKKALGKFDPEKISEKNLQFYQKLINK